MKKFIFALALFMCANSVTFASNESNAKRNLKAAQKELSSVTSKRDKAQLKQQQLQADYENALAKVEKNNAKPKSLAYKEAVKKSESLSGKLEQNAAILLSLNRQVDSLNNVVAACESASSNVSQTEIEEKQEVELAESDKNIIEYKEEITLPVNLQPVDKSNNEEKATIKEQKPVAAMDEKSADDSESSLNPFWTWVIIIGMGILFIWYFWVAMKRSLRCPKCGRWFVYEKDGVKVLNKQRDRNGSGRSWIISYERRYRCSNCGHKRVEKGKRYQSNPDLPSEWY